MAEDPGGGAAVGTRVVVRFFAAARAAAGVHEDAVDLAADATVDDLVRGLEARGARLAGVLARCSYLVDGVAVRDGATALSGARTVDVLPPFAGG